VYEEKLSIKTNIFIIEKYEISKKIQYCKDKIIPIVNKNYLIDSMNNGYFLDYTKYLINIENNDDVMIIENVNIKEKNKSENNKINENNNNMKEIKSDKINENNNIKEKENKSENKKEKENKKRKYENIENEIIEKDKSDKDKSEKENKKRKIENIEKKENKIEKLNFENDFNDIDIFNDDINIEKNLKNNFEKNNEKNNEKNKDLNYEKKKKKFEKIENKKQIEKQKEEEEEDEEEELPIFNKSNSLTEILKNKNNLTISKENNLINTPIFNNNKQRISKKNLENLEILPSSSSNSPKSNNPMTPNSIPTNDEKIVKEYIDNPDFKGFVDDKYDDFDETQVGYTYSNQNSKLKFLSKTFILTGFKNIK
jgi:hypothetical protein